LCARGAMPSSSKPAACAADSISEMLEFLRALRESGAEDVDAEKSIVQGCLDAFASGPCLSFAEGARLLKEVKAAGLRRETQDALVKGLQGKVSSEHAASRDPAQKDMQTSKKKMQKHAHLQEYLLKEEWELLQNSTASWDQKLQHVAKRFVSLGLTCLSENTSKLAVAMEYCASLADGSGAFKP
ncbi:unnamed protein product, partial [Effrenium voratum]